MQWVDSSPTACDGPDVTTLAQAVNPLYTRSSATIVVDDTRVYWADPGNNDNKGAILSVPRCGGAVTTIAPYQTSTTTIATDGTYVYWANVAGFTPGLMRAPVTGAGPTTMLAPASDASPYGIALDATRIYWTGPGVVASMLKEGGPVTTLATNQSFELVDSAIAIDDTTVYWEVSGHIRSVPKAGGAAVDLAATGSSPRFITVRGSSLYWYSDPSLFTVPTSGGAPVELTKAGASGLAVDDTMLYWAADFGLGAEGKGYVAKLPTAGGPPQMMVSGENHPIGMAVDATHIYWIHDRSILTMKK